jgi:hypothetical protein
MTLQDTKILAHLRMRGRMTRSVSIARDMDDPLALDGYITTPKVLETIRTIGQALRKRDTQRAWRIVGPYGSGKSALGLFLCHLAKGPRASHKAFELLSKVPVADDWRPGLGWLPIVITGARRPVQDCVKDALIEALGRITDMPKRTSIFAALTKPAPDQVPQIQNVSDMVKQFTEFAQGKGCKGLFFVFDELGKCLEFASMHPEQGDLYSLQQLAELTYGEVPLPIALVSLVHQHFEDYARDLSRHVSNEWGKVSSRFQELTFDEPVDQYLTLIAETIGVDGRISKAPAFRKAAIARVEQFRSVQRNGDAIGIDRVEKLASQLYPLHPACAVALPFIMKKFAQNERSLFAFLTEETPSSLRGFSAANDSHPDTCYSLANLYDYLSQGILRFANSEAQRKWEYVLHLASAGTLSEGESRVLKAISVIECCGPIAALETSLEAIVSYIGWIDSDIARQAIESLVESGVLVIRRGSNGLLIATEDAVRIESLQDEALESLSVQELQTHGLRRVLGRPVIAHRHYHQRGTQRSFEMRIGLIDRDGLFLPSSVAKQDGSIVLLLVGSDMNSEGLKDKFMQSAAASDPLAVYTLVQLDTENVKQLHALSIWTRVAEIASTRTSDNWTMRYIDRQLEDAEGNVRRNILAAVEGTDLGLVCPWIYMGVAVAEPERSSVVKIASWLADKLYTDSPRISNELINRNKLSSQIALARQKLIEAMYRSPTLDCFGIEGFPPEKAIYASIFSATGLHRPQNGGRTVSGPMDNDPCNVRPAWTCINETLASGEVIGIDAILQTLSIRPFGMRLGVSTTLLAAFIASNKQSVVLFERGTLIIEPTADHLARLFKNPKNFSIRAIRGHERKQPYLHKLASGVRLFARHTDGADAVSLTRTLIGWCSQLSGYAQGTLTVSKEAKAIRSAIKRATDPVALLCEALPEAVNGGTTPKEIGATIKAISDAIDELSIADRILRENVTAAIADAFHIQGDLPAIRRDLSTECQGPNLTAVEYRIKSFVTRCVDPGLTDDKWLESIAGLVATRSMDSWTDETIGQFALEIKGLAGQLHRWMDLMLDRGRGVVGAERVLRIAITNGSGQEVRHVIYRDSLTTAEKENAFQALVAATGISLENLGPLVAGLYLDLANPDVFVENEGTNNG